jgi:plastocyanin
LNIGRTALALSLALVFVNFGCSSNKPAQQEEQEPVPTAVVDPTTTGTITGTVTFQGTPPEFRPIDMAAEPPCVKANPTLVIPPVVVLGPNKELANVAVYIKSGLASYKYDTPTAPAVLDQKGCMYTPRVLALMTHQTLEIRNTDPTTHNVHVMPRQNKQWNNSLPAGGAPYETHFDHPELAMPVACNVHPWMRAFLFIFSHPYFEVTSTTGTFELKDVPAGTYTIEAWHERFGTQDQTVTIAPKESKAISFVFQSTAH